mmetsp:Transcript_79/g.241  ORF Transcript_79/g.241 Transcript_79/m.241 type:complete len:248 (+) Transcript_79:64-807(+)
MAEQRTHPPQAATAMAARAGLGLESCTPQSCTQNHPPQTSTVEAGPGLSVFCTARAETQRWRCQSLTPTFQQEKTRAMLMRRSSQPSPIHSSAPRERRGPAVVSAGGGCVGAAPSRGCSRGRSPVASRGLGVTCSVGATVDEVVAKVTGAGSSAKASGCTTTSSMARGPRSAAVPSTTLLAELRSASRSWTEPRSSPRAFTEEFAGTATRQTTLVPWPSAKLDEALRLPRSLTEAGLTPQASAIACA